MNINHLAIFHAVAEEGSLTRAAERLHVSQPAVSKQLRELEKSVGMALFHRLSKGVRLTEAGELLAGYARNLFAIEAEAEHALGELRGLERGRLTVGSSTTIGMYLLPQVLAHFHRQFPRIELHLEIANAEQIRQRLTDNTLDLALSEASFPRPICRRKFSPGTKSCSSPHPTMRC
jgi:DNA-binding transcriptional LysR family regulator